MTTEESIAAVNRQLDVLNADLVTLGRRVAEAMKR